MQLVSDYHTNIYVHIHASIVLCLTLLCCAGALDVVYEAVMGALEVDTTPATPDSDFNSTRMTFRLENGQLSTTITAPIIDVYTYIPTLICIYTSSPSVL